MLEVAIRIKQLEFLALYPSSSEEQHQTLCLLLGLYVALTLPFTYRCANLYRRDLMKGRGEERGVIVATVSLNVVPSVDGQRQTMRKSSNE